MSPPVEKQRHEVLKNGLWSPDLKPDACGVELVCSVQGKTPSETMINARKMLQRMTLINESDTGTGIQTAIPDLLYRKSVKEQGKPDLPPFGQYATGIVFIDRGFLKEVKETFEQKARECDVDVTWRVVFTNPGCLDDPAKKSEPLVRQVFISSKLAENDLPAFEKKLNGIRMMFDDGEHFYLCSLNTSTVVYKGAFNTNVLFQFYDDLTSGNFLTNFAIVHTCSSTTSISLWNDAPPKTRTDDTFHNQGNDARGRPPKEDKYKKDEVRQQAMLKQFKEKRLPLMDNDEIASKIKEHTIRWQQLALVSGLSRQKAKNVVAGLFDGLKPRTATIITAAIDVIAHEVDD